MIDWFPVLGNHEYRGNTQAVLDYTNISRRWTMPARYYTKAFEDKGATIRIVWIDTAPMMDKYRKDSTILSRRMQTGIYKNNSPGSTLY